MCVAAISGGIRLFGIFGKMLAKLLRVHRIRKPFEHLRCKAQVICFLVCFAFYLIGEMLQAEVLA